MEAKNSIPDNIKLLLMDYLSGTLADNERAFLERWIEEEQAHRLLLKELSKVWQASSLLNKKEEFNANEAWEEVMHTISAKSNTHSSLFIRLRPWLGVAALVALAFTLGLFSKSKLTNEPTANAMLVEMTTPLHSKAYVTLPDCTRIWLNSGTKIQYSRSYGIGERNIQLEGEAYFEVAKNKEVPFIVHTAGITVQALGTMFNVKSYPTDTKVETALTEGSVLLATHPKDGTEGVSVILKPDQVASYLKGENAFRVEEVSSTYYSAWKESRWSIRREPLNNLFKALQSRYGVTLSYPESQLKHHTFSGTIVNETLQEVLDMVKLTSPIDYTVHNGQVTIQLNVKQQKELDKLIEQQNKKETPMKNQ